MARRISSGLVGQPSVGGINVSPAAVISSSENQNITLNPTGTGTVVFETDALLNDQNDLRFGDADSSNYIAIQAPTTVATNYTLTLPNAVSGVNGYALTSDTSGVLSWSAAGAALTDNTSDASTNYLVFTTSTTGNLLAARVSTTKLSFQPSTGSLTVDGTVASLKTENIKTASHTLELADRNKLVAFNGGSAQTVTVPTNAAVPFPIGSVVYISRINTGTVTLAASGGVTLTKTGTLGDNEIIAVIKRGTDTWYVQDAESNLTATGGAVTTPTGFRRHTFTSGATNFVVS